MSMNQYAHPMFSLIFNFSGLRVFELLGFIDVQEQILQQVLCLAQFGRYLILMFKWKVFLFIFSILIKSQHRKTDGWMCILFICAGITITIYSLNMLK